MQPDYFIRVSRLVWALKNTGKEMEKYGAFWFLLPFESACNAHMKIYCSHCHKIIKKNKT